ncbi:hypothetical protein EDC94DRAFT_695488 [Helicostylum pulchrum]|nr:hypothetical protein EDC94DRAFT_695488 [Helicostylum pulchrum]
MSKQAIQDSEDRQIKLQLEYVNYTVEEILQQKVTDKKRKVLAKQSITKIEESDGIILSGLNESIVLAQRHQNFLKVVNKLDHPQSLYLALGCVSLQGAQDISTNEALGAALDKFGSASDELGYARLTMDHEIVSKFKLV